MMLFTTTLSSMERCTLRQGLSSEVIFSSDVPELQAVKTAAEHYQSLASTASLRQARIAVEYQETTQWPVAAILPEQAQIDIRSLRLLSSGINFLKYDLQMAEHHLYRSKKVMIEWKHLYQDVDRVDV